MLPTNFTTPQTSEDWNEVKKLRQSYFFDNVPTPDPYIWTFGHPEHKHFVLKLDTTIIGYAHIQLWPQSKAALRIIVIDEPHQGRGYGSQLLHLCEQWLQENKYQSIHTESRPSTLPFYVAQGYESMPFDDPDSHEINGIDIPVGKILRI